MSTPSSPACNDKGRRGGIGDGWTWLLDYVYAWADWTINCPDGRVCQVGMGLKSFGEPRGETLRFSGYREFTTVGVG